jgi:hypothetical protein
MLAVTQTDGFWVACHQTTVLVVMQQAALHLLACISEKQFITVHLSMYSETSANKENSFRNDIR